MSAQSGYYEQDYPEPDKGVSNLLRAHQRDALALPQPDEEFRYGRLVSDLHGGAEVAKRFAQNNIVEKSRKHPESDAYYWETNADIYAWIVDNCSQPDETPCGNATGIRTVEAGKVYTCTDDECDCRFDRHIAEEVVSDA